MDFHANLSSSSSLAFSLSSSPSFSRVVFVGGGERDRRGSIVSLLAEKFVLAIVSFVFVTVGLFAGVVTGALIGQATESGLLRGAGIGAISGVVFSIEVVESSLALWQSNDSGIGSILYVFDIVTSLLSGRLVRDKVGPAVQNAVESQMSAVDDYYSSSYFTEASDIFETCGTGGGMSMDNVEKLGKTEIGAEDVFAARTGEPICCSVCLQDFEIGETARSLPRCRHMFHLMCIDSWLIRRASCPLCRRDI